jgi:hypothetical protein
LVLRGGVTGPYPGSRLLLASVWVVIAMVEVQGEIVIDRRPEDVFDFVADEEN